MIAASRALAETLRMAPAMVARRSGRLEPAVLIDGFIVRLDSRGSQRSSCRAGSQRRWLRTSVGRHSMGQSGLWFRSPRRSSTRCDSAASRRDIIEFSGVVLDLLCARGRGMEPYRFPFHGFGRKETRSSYTEKWDYALRGVSEFIYNSTRKRNRLSSFPVWSWGRTAQTHVSSGIARLKRLACCVIF